MEDKIQQVRINFNKIKDIRNNVTYCFNALETKQTKLKVTTTEFVKNNRNNIFVFGLDSFQFQSKLIDYEYNDMKKFYLALNNRMYCEYYKLYKMIQEYIKIEINDSKFLNNSVSNKKYPVYKDLELNKNYDFSITSDLHETIILTIIELGDFLSNKMTKLNEDNKHYKKGLYIDNMINTINYNNAILIERINMFIHFMEAFNKHHTKYLLRLLNKSKIMDQMIDEDTNINNNNNNEDLTPPLTPNHIIKVDNVDNVYNVDNNTSANNIIDNAINEFNNNVIEVSSDVVSSDVVSSSTNVVSTNVVSADVSDEVTFSV